MTNDMQADETRHASGSTSLRAALDDGKNNWLPWVLGALAVAALVIIGFFALGGDVDVDVDPGNIDIDAPNVDVDVDAPDIDVELPEVDIEAPDIDIDPGSVDVEGGSIDVEEANADVDEDE